MCYFDQTFKNHQTTSNNSHSCRLQCTNCPELFGTSTCSRNLEIFSGKFTDTRKLSFIFLPPLQGTFTNSQVVALFVSFEILSGDFFSWLLGHLFKFSKEFTSFGRFGYNFHGCFFHRYFIHFCRNNLINFVTN